MNKTAIINKPHVIWILANESSAPYFNWFAELTAIKKNIQLSFICLTSEKPKMIEDVGQFGWNCYWIKFDHEKRKTGMIKAFFQLLILFVKLKPDVVHTHLFDDSLPSLFAAKIAGVKKRVITKADTSFHYFYAPKWVIADKFNNWNATHIVPVSNEAKSFILDKENAPENKITMIHHGIPSKLFTNQSEEYKRELINKYNLTGKKIFGTVSRFIEWKGYRYIIEAIPAVVEKYPNSLFLFVGQGSQKEELETLASKLNVRQHIVFTGWIDRAHIPSLYSILDVYVHAANFEPFGFVIPEAMMNAAPIVSTPTGSALDAIKHKVNGYLANYKDAKSLAEGITYTLEHGADFKEKGKQTALDMFEFDLMYNNYLNLYNKFNK
jgi:glycosyltransferase involved in cell wall biosynthesis